MRPIYKYLIIAALAVAVFGYIEWTPTLADPDSFYHAKFTAMLKDNWETATAGKFPWTYFTVWRETFADHHFLYHLAVVPIISVMSKINPPLSPFFKGGNGGGFAPLYAVKVAAVVFCTLFFLIFYWFLRRENIYGAFFYTILLFFSRGLLYRFGLPKAPVISAAILIFVLYFLLKKRFWPLAIVAFLYVWAYGGWPLIFVFLGFYLLAEILKEKILTFSSPPFKGGVGGGKFNFWRVMLRREMVLPVIFVSLGTALGLVFNPYFPENIVFYFTQYFRIFYTGYQNEVLVGNEWYPSGAGFLFGGALPVFILGASAIGVFVYGIFRRSRSENRGAIINKDEVMKIFMLAFIFGAFLIWTIQSRRNIEYLVPFGIIFFAFLNNFNADFFQRPKEIFSAIFGKRKFFGQAVVVIFVSVYILRALLDINGVRADFKSGYPLEKYRPAAAWLKQNTAPGEIIFHDNWSTFPMLFYWNDQNYYIFGEDPTAFWAFDRDLYRAYSDIIYKHKTENLGAAIRGKFNSKYVLLDMQNRPFDEALKSDKDFKLVYWDKEVKIYKLTGSN